MIIPLLVLATVVASAQPARLVPFEKGGRWGYKTTGGKVVLQPRWELANPFFAEGIAAVVDEKGWAYIDRKGTVIIRPVVVDNGPDYFAGGLARFTADGKMGFFDKRGRIVIPASFTFAWPFSESRAAVCEGCREVQIGEHRAVRDGKWGFIDRTGALVISIQFEDVDKFVKGTARVKSDGQWKLIDKNGAVVWKSTKRG